MGQSVSERDKTEDGLRDAAHDAFMAFWRCEACEQAALWAVFVAPRRVCGAWFRLSSEQIIGRCY
jgi:hypothetical protein